MSKSANLDELNQLLGDGINFEKENSRDKARECYGKAYQILISRAIQTRGDLARKRFSQASAVRSAYIRNGGFLSDENLDDMQKGSEILSSLGINIMTFPSVGFDGVAGLEDVKKEIQLRFIYPIRYHNLSEEYNIGVGGGLLLYGPPGVGKTHIARAVAKECGARFVYLNPSFLLSKWFGDFEKNISLVFKAARLLKPCILFFDEIDSIASRRDRTESEAAKRGVSQLLNEIGGINTDQMEGVYILGATNDPWSVDPALLRPGRFDRHIYVRPPDRTARARLLELNTYKIKHRGIIDIDGLADRTEGYTGADIEYICSKASQNVFLEAIKSGKVRDVETSDITTVLTTVHPSLSQSMTALYERFASGNPES